MRNGVYYNDVECFFTNEGRTTFVKQANGIQFAKIGAVLFSDKNKYLLNALRFENETFLNNLSFKQLESYTQLIFTDIGYTYEAGVYTPKNYNLYNDALVTHNYLLDVGISYEGEEGENSFSYNISLKTNSLNIDNNSSDDLNFDGIALIGVPYKPESFEYGLNGMIEEQTNTVLAIVYFKNDTEKLQIVHNQPSTVEFNTVINITLKDQIDLSKIKTTYVDSLNRPIEDKNVQMRNTLGLTKVNDGQTNVDNNRAAVGTINDLVISNLEMPVSYDSFSKLNIMTETNDEVSATVPQITLAQTTTGTNKTWNGDRLNIKYTSGVSAGYFTISEVTGASRHKLNFELFGEHNIYHTAVTGTFGNSFIYSRGNKIANDCYSNSFIHSDYNEINDNKINQINFINSNFNSINTQFINKVESSASQISFYNSNNNTVNSQCSRYSYIDENNKTVTAYKKGVLKNCTFVNSNGNYLKGKCYCPDDEDNFHKPNSTFINSYSGLYNLTESGDSLTMIGNTFGWVNAPTGNIIGIGEGLIQDGGESDKILLGYYNQNTTDPNEILVVGDGRMNKKWLKGQVSAIKDWNTNLTAFEKLMKTISGTGSTAKDSNFYRHNIFTVNKEGYITISDYDTNNSARYGFSGITAYRANGDNSTITYELPFNTMYDVLNSDQAYDMGKEELNSKITEIQGLIENITPTQFLNVSNKTNSTDNVQFSAYLNVPNDVITAYSETENKTILNKYTNLYTNNTVFTLSYVPVKNDSLPLNVIYWLRRKNHTDSTDTSAKITIKPYESKQFIKYSQVLTDNTLDGITIVE